MNFYESELFQLMPSSLDVYINNRTIPSINHCVGTQKLIGEYFGESICNVCEISNVETKKDFSLLASFLRSYIVIDDFLKDNFIEDRFLSFNLSKWLMAIKDVVLKILDKYDSLHLWNVYYKIYDTAYYNFQNNKLYDSVIKKCYLVFLLFDIPIVKNYEKSAFLRKNFENYLFSLQLLDDFHDMEEDQLSPNNHNLFLAQITKSKRPSIIENRNLLLISLIDYIKNNLLLLHDFNDNLLRKFFSQSLHWLQCIRNEHSNYPNIKLLDGNFIDYSFSDTVLSKFYLNGYPKYKINLSQIKAENVHTLFT